MQPNRLSAILAVLLPALIISCNQAAKEPVAAESTSKNQGSEKVEMVRNFYTSLENGDWAAIEKITAADFTDHSPWTPPAGTVGRDTLIKSLKDFKAGFPNMKFEVLRAAADSDIVFVQYHFTASNDGPFMGMPATNKKVDYTGVDMVRIKDGMATEHWDYGDNVTYMKQMGLMP